MGIEQASQSGGPCAAPGGLCPLMLMSAYYFGHVIYSGDQRHCQVSCVLLFTHAASCGAKKMAYAAVLMGQPGCMQRLLVVLLVQLVSMVC